MRACVRVCACVCACVYVYVRARACVFVCVWVGVRAHACVRATKLKHVRVCDGNVVATCELATNTTETCRAYVQSIDQYN